MKDFRHSTGSNIATPKQGQTPETIANAGVTEYPLPWRYSKEDGCLIAANGNGIDWGMDVAQFDAAMEFKAQAVNMHKELVTVLEKCANELRRVGNALSKQGQGYTMGGLIEGRARKLIQQAKGV